METEPNRFIEKLNLIEHPEGGYYKETYRSSGEFTTSTDGETFPNGRAYSTAIYYLLTGGQVSKFHRIRSDEIWHFYAGTSATIHIIHPDSLYQALYLGSDIENGQQFQHIVPAQCWFGVTVDNPAGFFLAGCTVAPGFDFRDFEMADPYKMKQAFPEHNAIIDQLS